MSEVPLYAPYSRSRLGAGDASARVSVHGGDAEGGGGHGWVTPMDSAQTGAHLCRHAPAAAAVACAAPAAARGAPVAAAVACGAQRQRVRLRTIVGTALVLLLLTPLPPW